MLNPSAAADLSGQKPVSFLIPSTDASSALRMYAEQADQRLIYSGDAVMGLRTQAVRGAYAPREALEQMLRGTGLVITVDEKSGAVAIHRSAAIPNRVVPGESPDPNKPRIDPMNPAKSRGKLRVWLASLILAATTAATAQETQESEAAKKKDEVVILTPFAVSATSDVGYGSLMNTSGRLAKPYQDVSQMANVITSELLHDMKRLDSQSALTFVPGVNTAISTLQSFTMRGLDTSASFIDGFKAPGFGHGVVHDIAFTDRVEVIKGPAPGAFGRGDPAGFINFVSKEPTFHRSTDVDVMVGTGNDETMSQRYMIDTNGLLTDDGKTAYRLVAVSSQGADAPSFSEYEHNGVLLALKRNFTGRGSLSVKAIVQKDQVPGTITPLNAVDQDFQNTWNNFLRDLGAPVVEFPLLDRNAWLAYDSTQTSSRTFSATAVLDYKLSEHWSTRQAAKFLQTRSNADLLFNGSYQYAADGITPLSTPVRILQANTFRSSSYQSDFVGQYKIPSIGTTLELLAGGDVTATTSKAASDTRSNFNPQPLTNWNPHLPLPGWSINPDVSYYREFRYDSSVYAQLEARFWDERLRINGVWRKNFTDLKSKNTISGVKTDTTTKSPLLPAYSALFKIDDGLSVYALYSQYIDPPVTSLVWVAVPQSDPRSQERRAFQPQTVLAEIGIKGNLLGGRFSFSACAYDLKQSGRIMGAAVLDPVSTDQNGIISYRFPSEAGARGFEFECFSKITNNLTCTLNGTYVFSSHTLGVFNPIGKPSIFTDHEMVTNPNTLSGYATYRFSGNRRQGLALTAGLKTIFSGWRMQAVSLRAEKYPHTNTIVDLGASYGLNDRWEIYVKGNNILERAFTPTGAVGGVVFGRKILAGVTAHF